MSFNPTCLLIDRSCRDGSNGYARSPVARQSQSPMHFPRCISNAQRKHDWNCNPFLPRITFYCPSTPLLSDDQLFNVNVYEALQAEEASRKAVGSFALRANNELAGLDSTGVMIEALRGRRC